MKSWKSAVSSVVPAMARSTCASPSTSRRTVMPASRTSATVGDGSAGGSPVACSRIRRATSSGLSAGARCPTSSSTTSRPFFTPTAISSRLCRWRRHVVRARDCEDRCRDLVQAVTYVERRERLADQRVALPVRVLQGMEQCGSGVGFALEEARGEPVRGGALEHDRGAGRAYGRGALVPPLGLADLRAGAQQRRRCRCVPVRRASAAARRRRRPSRPRTRTSCPARRVRRACRRPSRARRRRARRS